MRLNIATASLNSTKKVDYPDISTSSYYAQKLCHILNTLLKVVIHFDLYFRHYQNSSMPSVQKFDFDKLATVSKMKCLVKIVIFAIVALHVAHCKVFTRCELTEELKKQGFPEHQIRDWVCLVESESTRNSTAKGGPNWDGSYDWGLFQINDYYWCKVGYPGGVCKISCESLLSDDISTSTKCVKTIYGIHGFDAWYGWKYRCQGNLPDLSDCDA
ncbi:lysozyme-like [Arctopsyche grandis]|uniref:lysozyme-like n=1 Tax=Arctopsyche grandis TaxID=121162 RepID=UPI00406D738D